MAAYEYHARDLQGKLIKGEGDFDNEAEVRAYVRMQHLVPIKIHKKSWMTVDIGKISMFQPKVKTKDIAIFCRQFAVMIEAGISIGDSLGILSKQTENTTFRKVIHDTYEGVQQGRSLSEVTGEHTQFPELLVNMIEIGEVGGTLEQVLLNMAVHYEKEMRLIGKVKKAMTYPLIVVGAICIIVPVIMIFVVPRFVQMFQQAGVDLPTATKIIISVSTFMQQKWMLLILGVIALIFGIKTYKKTQVGKEIFDHIALNMPISKNVTHKVIIARFANTLGMLLSSGVPMIQAFHVVGKVIGNTVVQKELEQAISEVQRGYSLADSIADSKNFSPMLISMLRIGEVSGSLDGMMKKTGDFYDGEVETAVAQMVMLIEPLITLFIAFIVGGIMLAVILPMFTMASEMM